MMLVVRITSGLLLIAHGLVHLLYLASDVPEFSLDRSWLIPEAVRRPFGLALMTLTVAGFATLALAFWGVPGLASSWPVITLVAGLASAVLLVVFWNARLVFGITIDIALAALALLQPTWMDTAVGGDH